MSTMAYPGYTDKSFAEVYTKIPENQPKEQKPGQLTQAQLKQFFDDGFLILDKFYTPEEIQPAKDNINKLVDFLANQLYNDGKIKDKHEDKGLYERLTYIEEQYKGSIVLLHKMGVMPQGFRDLWSNERILNMMEQLLGTTEIMGHPVWNLRTKTPQSEATIVPWHQDVAYLDNDSYDVMQMTAWIPLLDTNATTGCCQMLKGGHKKGLVANHKCCWKSTHYVMMDEEDLKNRLGHDAEKEAVTCEVPEGGILLFSNMMPHRSLNNSSDKIRWSLDLRWQRADKPVGFHGLKEGIPMRSADPNFKMDWKYLDDVQKEKALLAQKKPDGEYDTSIAGPWMGRWEMTHTNQHTDMFLKVQQGGEKLTWH